MLCADECLNVLEKANISAYAVAQGWQQGGGKGVA